MSELNLIGLKLPMRARWPTASVIACWLIVAAMPGSVVAHPFHISTAEVEYDVKTDRLQVSLKLQAIDLEQLLSQTAGERVSIEQADTPERITELLNRTFFLASNETVPTQAATATSSHGSPSRDTISSAPEFQSQETTQHTRSKVHWVGQELKGAWLWIYFELELPTARAQLQLFNTVLFEATDSQINTVSVRHGKQRTTLKFSIKQPSANFDTRWLEH